MTLTATTTTSGAAFGFATILLLQQLGFLPLSDLLGSLAWIGFGVILGGVAFGVVGWHVDHP